VFYQGEDITVRGRPTKEILNNVVEIVNSRQRVVNVPGRRWNPFLAVSEGLWIIAGMDEWAPLLPYNSRAGDFSDDGVTNNGAYGKRLYDNGLAECVRLLNDDPDTRRAVVPIYTAKDVGAVSKDIPCNIGVEFKIRAGRLYLTVLNRSNDIHWGLFAVNLCQFSMLQEVVAICTGTNMGTQTHISNSFHVYTDKLGSDITNPMLEHQLEEETRYADMEQFPAPMNKDFTYASLDQFKEWAHLILCGESAKVALPEWFSFMDSFLWSYRTPSKSAKIRRMSEVEAAWSDRGYNDWLDAGKRFLLNG
jgi:hypothetical protein